MTYTIGRDAWRAICAVEGIEMTAEHYRIGDWLRRMKLDDKTTSDAIFALVKAPEVIAGTYSPWPAMHPLCHSCGWAKGGVGSWDGKCKCGHYEQPMTMEP